MFYLRVLMFFVVLFFSVISCTSKSDKTLNNSKDSSSVDMSKASKRIKDSKILGKAFAKGLQKELKSAIATKGLASAISVCKEVSASYEEEFRKKDSDIISFRRISAKTRNADSHTPTDKEMSWLVSMAKGIAGGSKPKPGVLEASNKLTVLLPIVIKKDVCLKCHGDSSKFSSDLRDALRKNYPLDKAVGFKMNDLRGALAIEWRDK